MRHAKRRKSVVEDGRSNLKQKFAQMRRQSENVAHTVKKFRAQHSIGGDCDSGSQSDAGMTTDASEAPQVRVLSLQFRW